MREVELIKLEKSYMVIADYSDGLQFHRLDEMPERINNSHEFIVNCEVETENVPVNRIVDHGITHYMCVERKVWEYLYLIDNPVTAKSQEENINYLKGKVSILKASYDSTSHEYNQFSKRAYSASLLTRLKWLFTGFKGDL